MADTSARGGEAALMVYESRVLSITDPYHRQAVNDISKLFPNGSFDLESGAEGPALAYAVPGIIRARRLLGTDVATVEIPLADALSFTVASVYKDVAEGRRAAALTSINPQDRAAYAAAPTHLDIVRIMAARTDTAQATEFAGVPGADYPEVVGVLAEAYRQDTALEAASFALQGLADLVLPD